MTPDEDAVGAAPASSRSGRERARVVQPGDEVLGRYRVVRFLASGAMGRVFEAHDAVLDQPVALKQVLFDTVPGESAEETTRRTLREARTAALLRGEPHVVAIWDVQEADGDVWLVLEYVPSRSLAQILADGPLPDPGHVARIGAQIAGALAAAHHRRILHRDVKPGNVLIADADGTAKLTDFGISYAEGDVRLTAADVVSGTPAYMAPEVARGEEATAASDVFSLGATLYACVEGAPPFGTEGNPRQILHRAGQGAVRPPERAGPLEPVLRGMLQPHPDARPDAAAVAGLLDGIARHVDAPAFPAAVPVPAPRRRGRRIALAVTAVAVLAGAGALVVTRPAAAPVAAPAPTTAPAPVPAGPFPVVVGPRAVTGDPRAVDPCALFDLPALQTLGTARIDTRTNPGRCRVHVTRPTGTGETKLYDVDVEFVASGLVEAGATRQDIGSLQIRRGKPYLTGGGRTGCSTSVVLSDGVGLKSTVVRSVTPGADPCALAEQASVAVARIVDRSGVPYDPARNARFSMRATDSCGLLTGSEIAAQLATGRVTVTRGFADWSCRWRSSAGTVWVYLAGGAPDVDRWGDVVPGAPKPAAVQVSGKSSCYGTVLHRTGSGAERSEFVQVAVARTGTPAAQLCTTATALALAAEGRAPAP